MPEPVRFTLDQLLVLEAIVETGTFAGAAKALYRVPSAISYTIRTLEEMLEVQLFDRTGHKATLTPAGRRILEEGGDLLHQARQLDRLARQIQTGWEPELQIVVDGVVPMHPITRALRAFREEQIPTRIRLDVEYQEGVPDRWEADGADLMIILDFEDRSDTLVRTALPALQMLCVVGADHPLSEMDNLNRAGLAAHMELVVKDSSPKYAKSPKRPFGESQHLTFLSDFHSKRLALLDGAGFGWIPRHLIESDLKTSELVVLATELCQWEYHPELVHRKDKPLGRAGQRFVDVLLAEIKGA